MLMSVPSFRHTGWVSLHLRMIPRSSSLGSHCCISRMLVPPTPTPLSWGLVPALSWLFTAGWEVSERQPRHGPWQVTPANRSWEL